MNKILNLFIQICEMLENMVRVNVSEDVGAMGHLINIVSNISNEHTELVQRLL